MDLFAGINYVVLQVARAVLLQALEEVPIVDHHAAGAGIKMNQEHEQLAPPFRNELTISYYHRDRSNHVGTE